MRTHLGRRLQRMEAALRVRSKFASDLHRAMVGLALEHLSDDSLGILEEIVQQGKTEDQWDQRESRAVQELAKAFEEEIRKAGYSSVLEYHRICGDH